MKLSTERSSLMLSAFFLCIGLAGCHDGGHRHWNKTIQEREPNDIAENADLIGSVFPGSFHRIRGHITEGGFDVYDGFAFRVAAPTEVEIVLSTDDLFADLDFCIYDPILDDFVFCFEDGFDPEVGVFLADVVGDEFHVVVTSYRGDSSYTLEVSGFDAYFQQEEPEVQALGLTDAGNVEDIALDDDGRDRSRWNGYRQRFDLTNGAREAHENETRVRGRIFLFEDGAQAGEGPLVERDGQLFALPARD